jgi:CheY-like chemotaxis protein
MKQLGDILVQTGIISNNTLKRALEVQKKQEIRLGAALEKMGVLTQEELAEALAKQFNFKMARDFAHRSFDQQMLSMIPVEFAIKNVLFPLKQNENMLAVATNGPCEQETMELLSRFTGCNIIPVFSSRKEILDAIAINYLNSTATCHDNNTILVVDNVVSSASVTQFALSSQSFTVHLAHDGLEALQVATKERPALIVTELYMPGMSGYALLRSIQNNPMTDHIPLIALTTETAAEEEQTALEWGFADYIMKPSHPVRITARVKHTLENTRKNRI